MDDKMKKRIKDEYKIAFSETDKKIFCKECGDTK
jgi:RNase P subunit RPR2